MSLFNILIFFYILPAVYLKRVIVHPSFKNVSFKEAEKLLDAMDQGDVIIRPSSKVCCLHNTNIICPVSY